MGAEYLIDSNVVIDFCNGKLPLGGRDLLFGIEQPVISIVTYIETLGFTALDENEENKLRDFLSIVRIISLDLEVALKTIEIKQKLRIKLPDAAIAATSFVYHLNLITRNTNDFKNIKGIKLINTWAL